MINDDEKYLNLEKKFQEMLDTQKKFYESELELLKSKYEYELTQLRMEYENQISQGKKDVEDYYNVKNTQDAQSIKQYYEDEIKNQAQWYEKEIVRRQNETAKWHENNLKEKLAALTKGYEEMLSAQNDKFNVETEILSNQLIEQKKFYEEQLKPFRRLIRIKKKLNFNNKKQDIKEEDIHQVKEIKEEIRPKVSVILPVYNVGKYLRQSLESLLNQTLKEIEIICVNDGSTDDSYNILEEYKEKDNRIKVIHKENKGTGAARNDGLRIASGECIGFVDPDDWVKPNMFERLYSLIKEKDLDIAMCMPDGYDEKNAVNKPFPYFIDENFDNIPVEQIFNWRDLSPFKYPMCVWNKLYTKDLFDKYNIEFAEGLDFEDHKVIFGTLLCAEKIYFIREKLYVYRFNREGSVLSDNNRRLIDHIEIFNIVENLMKETNTFEALRFDFLKYKIHNLLYYYSMIKDEYKAEYYKNMIKSIKETNITGEEQSKLCELYPELKGYMLPE